MAQSCPPPVATQPGRPAWLPRSAFPFQSRFADVGGSWVHYVDEGSGPALLFVSAGQWSFMFRDVIVRLREQFRCLALDFPGCGLSADPPSDDHSVESNAQVLKSFVSALDLQDVTMVVHDVGGPVGFVVAINESDRFRALVVSNTFGWPLAGYPQVRRVLNVIASPLFGAVNNRTNALALFTATSYGVGRKMTRQDRRAFLGPWRSPGSRLATQQILAGVLAIEPLLAEIERSLPARLAGVPVLTMFGLKNDRYGWQTRFRQMFAEATEAGIVGGRHFPFCDDPDAYAAALSAWWAQKVANL